MNLLRKAQRILPIAITVPATCMLSIASLSQAENHGEDGLEQARECNEMGTYLSKQGKHEAATDQFKKACTLYPRLSSRFLCNQANEILKMGVRDRYDYSPQAKVHREETIIKALECYDKAINLDPNFAIAIYDRANVLRLRDRDLSEKEYKKALSLDPDMVEARVNLSEIYISAFRFNEARELLLEANKHPVGKLRNNKSLVTEALKQLKKWQAILKHQKDPGAGCLGVGPLPGDVLQFCPQMSIRILISQRQAKEKIVDGGPCPPNLTTPHSR